MSDFHEVAGDEIPCDGLILPRARDLAVIIADGISPHVDLIACYRQADGRENVVFDVRPTVPQRPIIPIKRTERLLASFRPEDNWYPDVRALRRDFPREGVLHLNLVPEDEPASLCLFVLPWNDIKVRLTANELLHRVQVWLNDAPMNVLHRDDQPLEPLFLTAPSVTPLILSPGTVEMIANGTATINLGATFADGHLIFAEQRSGRRIVGGNMSALAIPLVSKPHEHHILYNAPANFEQLHEQLQNVGIDLLSEVQKVLLVKEQEGKQTGQQGLPNQGLGKYRYLAILLILLRKRRADAAPEPQMAAFFCAPDNPETGLVGIARRLGLSGDRYDQNKRGQDVTVHVMGVRYELTPESAALYSGHSLSGAKLVAIGAGAIGSQVVLQATKGGLSNWTIIDADFLLPHNLVRHELGGEWLGLAKAKGVEFQGNNIFDKPTLSAIVADVQNPGDHEKQILSTLAEADAVVDMSASVSVARDLSFNTAFKAKRCSMFVSPSGKDFVFMGEDQARQFRLDQIEAQYFRAVASSDDLRGHLAGGSTIGSCRNITSRVPEELMALHAATGVRSLRRWLESDQTSALVTTTNDVDMSVRQLAVPFGTPIHLGKLGEWEVETDALFLQQLAAQRASYLPNETGGVLLAQIDVPRRILYVCHHIPAPSDSERQPTMYIRGNAGLQSAYDEVQRRTMHHLVYIGEWHSHPDHCACFPSMDDVRAGAWLAEKTREGCLPGLMLIVGEDEQTCWILCTQETAASPSELRIIQAKGGVVQ